MKLAIFGVLAFVLGLGGSTGTLVFTTPVRVSHADSVAVAKRVAERKAAEAAAQLADGGDAVLAPAPAPRPRPAVAPAPAPRETAATVTAPAAAPPIAGLPANVLAATSGHAPEVKTVPTGAESGVHEGRSATPPDGESYKQVGSILLNMKPVEAAKIVGYLNDDQVEGLLRSMSPRQAAGVLGQLAPERAAALSRRLLTPAKGARP